VATAPGAAVVLALIVTVVPVKRPASREGLNCAISPARYSP
jgi:hypothetical protein